MRVYKRKRSAFYWCRVRNAAGKIVRRSTKCTDFKAANIAADEFEREAVDPNYAAAKAARLDVAVTAYFDELKRRRSSAATIEIAETKCGHLVRIWGADSVLLSITPTVVQQYIARREGEGASQSTVHKELKALRGVLLVAKHEQRWHGDIKAIMPMRYGAASKPRERWVTPEEFRALLEQLGPARAAHLSFMVATGARREESYRACREDVDFERGVVRIRGSKTEKSAGEVPITRLMDTVLRFALEHAPGRAPLFLSWGNLYRDVNAACVRAGIVRCTPNDLRRTFGKWHRLAGIEPSLLAPMLRHTTDKLAQTTYAKVTGSEVRQLVEARLESVSNSCSANEKNEKNESKPDDSTREESEEIILKPLARPGRFERPTTGLEVLASSSESSMRSLGTKLGVARSKDVPGVSIVNAEEPRAREDPSSRRRRRR